MNKFLMLLISAQMKRRKLTDKKWLLRSQKILRKWFRSQISLKTKIREILKLSRTLKTSLRYLDIIHNNNNIQTTDDERPDMAEPNNQMLKWLSEDFSTHIPAKTCLPKSSGSLKTSIDPRDCHNALWIRPKKDLAW